LKLAFDFAEREIHVILKPVLVKSHLLLENLFLVFKMCITLHRIVFLLYFQFNLMLATIALEPDLYKLMRQSQSAKWPLKSGYPGLSIQNLNEYVSLFSHCLVNIQNYQGIEIIGIKSPVYITRFDVANLPSKVLRDNPSHWNEMYAIKSRRFFFGKIPPKSEQNYSMYDGIDDNVIQYTDKSMKTRWYCSAQFDLFHPEPEDAPHIVFHAYRYLEKNLLIPLLWNICGWLGVNALNIL